MDLAERFWAKVERAEGCWLWTGYLTPKGYGRFTVAGGSRKSKRSMPASRVAYALANGGIPDGLHIDHLCRNPPCVNPAHLEAVTPRENARRRGPYCKNGHLRTPENTGSVSGWRDCLVCREANTRRKRALALRGH